MKSKPIPLTNKYPRCPKGMSIKEWQARVDLAAVYRLTDYYGWTSVVYNHITLRVPDTDTFLINPFGLRYDEIRASNLVRLDLKGNKLDNVDWPINKAGYNIHSAIHQARSKDLHCVMHTHEPMNQTIAALKVPDVADVAGRPITFSVTPAVLASKVSTTSAPVEVLSEVKAVAP